MRSSPVHPWPGSWESGQQRAPCCHGQATKTEVDIHFYRVASEMQLSPGLKDGNPFLTTPVAPSKSTAALYPGVPAKLIPLKEGLPNDDDLRW